MEVVTNSMTTDTPARNIAAMQITFNLPSLTQKEERFHSSGSFFGRASATNAMTPRMEVVRMTVLFAIVLKSSHARIGSTLIR